MPKQLPSSLFIMRITIAFFLAPWIADKFTTSGVEHTAKIFERFYKIKGLSETGSYAIGAFWVLLLLAFVLGFKKRISYGLVMLLHGLGVVFTWGVIWPFSEGHNMLFLAAVPVLGAMIALYKLRDYDTLLTVGK
ncbi:MAG: hypothetical protein ACSHXY_06845 [Alphaproteobacteria bacterium]